MAWDKTKPADGSALVSAEIRANWDALDAAVMAALAAAPAGTVLYVTGGHVFAAAPGAAEGYALRYVAGVPTWQAMPAAGMTNPMTAAGDLIIGGASGAAGRLPKDTDGMRLTLVGGMPAWVPYTDFREIASPGTPPADVARAYASVTAGSTRFGFLDPTGTDYTVAGIFKRQNWFLQNSAALTTILTQTVKGTLLSETNRALSLTGALLFQNNTGGTGGVTFRVKLGGLTILTVASGLLAANASYRGGDFTFSIVATGGTGWTATGRLALYNPGHSGLNYGVQMTDASLGLSGILGPLDFTTDLTLEISIQLSAANAALQCSGSMLVELR